jgi:hypothetical protein
MSLKKELRYDASHDQVDGLVHVQNKKPQVANQALVFMARGLGGNIFFEYTSQQKMH